MAIFESVPQRALLYSVDAMITHGGMNSVLECIQAHVPILAYPLSAEWDQPGVAARVQYHGLGLSAPIRSAKASRIHDKLLHLFSNYESYKSRLKAKQFEIEQNSKTSLADAHQLIDRHFNHITTD